MFLTTFLPLMLRGGAAAVVVPPPADPAYVEFGYIESGYVEFTSSTPALAAGTFTFTQAPTDADTFNTAVLTQATSAALEITGIRHNLHVTASTSDILANNFSRWAAQWTAMQSAGLKLYLCLFDGGSGGAGMVYPGDDANSVTAAAERTAWANPAVAAMVHLQDTYPGLLVAAELWNEPDGQWPVPADRLCLLAAELRTKMNAQPKLAGVPLAAPATVTGEGTYWQTLVANQLLTHVNWVSHHMYSDPHMLERRVANLRTRLAPATPPIFVSEFGANLATEAPTLAGTLTMLKALGIHAASHFTLQDYGTAFADRGLLNSTGLIGEQGTVWKAWHQTVGIAAVYAGKDSLPSNIQCHRFTVGANTVRVAWASLGAPIISITGTHTVKDVNGATLTPATTRTLGLSPVYLTGLTGAVTVALAAGQETLLAYPEIDFSTTQGLNGWTYQSFATGTGYMDAQADAINDRWTIPSSGVWLITPTVGHPTSAGATAAVRKWTVPAGITRVRVTGTFARGPGGDGVDVTLLHNTTIRFRRALLAPSVPPAPPTTVAFNQVFDVLTGAAIEFRVGPGPGTNVDFDTTVLHALIYSTTAAVTGVDIA